MAETLKEAIVKELTAWDRRFDGPETIAEAVLQLCWDEINHYIRTGPLGEPAHSERNGLILAANMIHPRAAHLLESGGKKVTA